MSDPYQPNQPSPEQLAANKLVDDLAHGPWAYGKHDGSGNGMPKDFPWLAEYLHGPASKGPKP